jgi:hypothetical protein
MLPVVLQHEVFCNSPLKITLSTKLSRNKGVHSIIVTNGRIDRTGIASELGFCRLWVDQVGPLGRSGVIICITRRGLFRVQCHMLRRHRAQFDSFFLTLSERCSVPAFDSGDASMCVTFHFGAHLC